jgi:hypothetical protein
MSWRATKNRKKSSNINVGRATAAPTAGVGAWPEPPYPLPPTPYPVFEPPVLVVTWDRGFEHRDKARKRGIGFQIDLRGSVTERWSRPVPAARDV